jgi:hypothetical protein
LLHKKLSFSHPFFDVKNFLHQRPPSLFAAHREAAWKRRPQEWLAVEVSRFISFGEEAQAFLEGLNRTGQPIKKNLAKLLALHDQYGTADLIQALKRANAHHAYGAAYVEDHDKWTL